MKLETFTSPDPTAAEIQSGREALRLGALEKARTHFQSALDREKTPEALEGLASAQWLLGDAASLLPLLEAAYALYQKRGDPRAAARIATHLALEHEAHRGERAVASGWLQRAHRLLEGVAPCDEQAWLAAWEGHLALLYHDDPETARRRIAEARALAGPLNLSDVDFLCLGLEGVALVRQCDISEGMRRLDEVTAAAVGGEMSRLDAAGNASCYLLTACERVWDFDRAAQWYEKVRSYLERVRMVPALTFCRDHMIGILLWRGAWAEAEKEIGMMIREAETIAPRFVEIGMLRLANLRYRQGRRSEAADLFARADSEPSAGIGRAAMALDEGEPDTAVALVERFFRKLSREARLDRASGLDLLARAHAASGRLPAARAALSELSELADSVSTEGMRAILRAAEGAVALGGGELEAACRSFEDAVDLFEKTGGAFENARVRLELAGALHRLERDTEAEREAAAALSIARRIGAAGEARRAAAFLEQAQRRRSACAEAPAVPGLTKRETEVLRLVAGGLSNPEIAERLFLSEHTIKRHVANILAKLDLPSRAAAAAHAARLGAL